jgi:hypothetical protein
MGRPSPAKLYVTSYRYYRKFKQLLRRPSEGVERLRSRLSIFRTAAYSKSEGNTNKTKQPRIKY